MELTHSFTVPAGVEDTWQTFMDLQLVGGCFPGATVTEVTEAGFSGTVKVKLGPIALVYAGSGSFVERDEDGHRAVLEAKGKDKRGNGTAGATVTIRLTAEGDDATRAEVTTDLTVTGKPAQFGRGVMQDVSDKLLQQFIDCIEGRLGPPPQAAPAATEVAEPVAAPAQPTPAQPTPAQPTPAQPTPAQPTPVRPVAGQAPVPARPLATAEEGAAIDLGSTVGPVLLKTYGPRIAVGAVVLALVVWLVRRCRC
jgi:carbon monoxide dehydrogenase subunit G